MRARPAGADLVHAHTQAHPRGHPRKEQSGCAPHTHGPAARARAPKTRTLTSTPLISGMPSTPLNTTHSPTPNSTWWRSNGGQTAIIGGQLANGGRTVDKKQAVEWSVTKQEMVVKNGQTAIKGYLSHPSPSQLHLVVK